MKININDNYRLNSICNKEDWLEGVIISTIKSLNETIKIFFKIEIKKIDLELKNMEEWVK